MVLDPNSAQVVGIESKWKVRLVPDSDSGNLAHKYRMAEMVQKGWTHLEVKGYTWQIKILVHETFSLLAQ
jgi:hypothetical protein